MRMASSEQTDTLLQQGPELKYLEFFRLAMLQATSYVFNFYEYLKDGSGPLKPGVDNLESTVKTVVRPVLQQLQHKPVQLLVLADNKVDATIALLTGFIPEFVRANSRLAFDVAKQAPETARVAYADIRDRGLYSTAKCLYQKYEPVAEEWSYNRWKLVRSLPLVPQVVDAVTLVALYGAHKLNHLLLAMKVHKLPLSCCIPLLPVEKNESAIPSVENPVGDTDRTEQISQAETTEHSEKEEISHHDQSSEALVQSGEETNEEDWHWVPS